MDDVLGGEATWRDADSTSSAFLLVLFSAVLIYSIPCTLCSLAPWLPGSGSPW